MNIIEKYYMRKANSFSTDDKYNSIEEGDIKLIRNAEFYMVAAPIATVGAVYLLNKLRSEMLMSQHFFYAIKRYQDNFQSKYRRQNDRTTQQYSDSQQSSNEQSQNNGDQNVGSIYQQIEQQKKEELLKQQEALKLKQEELMKSQKEQQQYKKNPDPLQRRLRQKQLQSQGVEEVFSSRKITSRKEENISKKLASPNPGQYIEGAAQQYYESFEKQRGSLYTETLNEQQKRNMSGPYEAQENQNSFNKSRSKMRGMRFGGIRETFQNLVKSGKGQRRLTIFMYLFPALVSFGLAGTNYLQVTFGIYLKYQALVDSFYLQQKDTNELSFLTDTQAVIMKQIQNTNLPQELAQIQTTH
eukprot:403333981